MTREYFLKQLKIYDNMYFNEGTPAISDTEYDLFKESFRKEYPDDPYFAEVGAGVASSKGGNKYTEIKLPFVAGGLEKVDVDTVEAWVKKQDGLVVASEKIDGNSVVCSWENSKLVFAASRGDGETGQNLLNKAQYFLPGIPVNGKVTLRGEVLLEGDLYFSLGFKNRRNGVTGILRRDDIDISILSKLSVIFYEVIEPRIDMEVKRLDFIEKTLRLRCVKWVIGRDPKTFPELLLKYKEEANYDIDGLVLTCNTSIHEDVKYPKNKVKFKVNELAKKCRVMKVEWNVTRTGTVVPVVLIEPTEIMGVTVSRCSGFNCEFITMNHIGTDAVVGVVRSGDVIPYITEVFVQAENIDIPVFCPECGSILRLTEKHIICDNELCPRKQIFTVSHFLIEMGADNITDRTVEMLGVYTVEDAYLLDISDIEVLPGFGRTKAETIYNEIQKTLVTKPDILLAAFGMPLIGTTLSKAICSKIAFEKLFEIPDASFLGLGPITTQTLMDNIRKYKGLYDFLKGIGLKFKEEEVMTLQGVEFALTGAGPLKRREYEKMVEDRGGRIKSVGKNTKYLVTDDVSTNSAKIQAARKFGTEIITYERFMEIMG